MARTSALVAGAALVVLLAFCGVADASHYDNLIYPYEVGGNNNDGHWRHVNDYFTGLEPHAFPEDVEAQGIKYVVGGPISYAGPGNKFFWDVYPKTMFTDPDNFDVFVAMAPSQASYVKCVAQLPYAPSPNTQDILYKGEYQHFEAHELDGMWVDAPDAHRHICHSRFDEESCKNFEEQGGRLLRQKADAPAHPKRPTTYEGVMESIHGATAEGARMLQSFGREEYERNDDTWEDRGDEMWHPVAPMWHATHGDPFPLDRFGAQPFDIYCVGQFSGGGVGQIIDKSTTFRRKADCDSPFRIRHHFCPAQAMHAESQKYLGRWRREDVYLDPESTDWNDDYERSPEAFYGKQYWDEYNEAWETTYFVGYDEEGWAYVVNYDEDGREDYYEEDGNTRRRRMDTTTDAAAPSDAQQAEAEEGPSAAAAPEGARHHRRHAGRTRRENRASRKHKGIPQHRRKHDPNAARKPDPFVKQTAKKQA